MRYDGGGKEVDIIHRRPPPTTQRKPSATSLVLGIILPGTAAYRYLFVVVFAAIVYTAVAFLL